MRWVAVFAVVLCLGLLAPARAGATHRVYLPKVIPGDGVVGVSVRPPWTTDRRFRLVKSVYFRSAGAHTIVVLWRAPDGSVTPSQGSQPSYVGTYWFPTTVASSAVVPPVVGEWSATLLVDGWNQGTTSFAFDGQVATVHYVRPESTWGDPWYGG